MLRWIPPRPFFSGLPASLWQSLGLTIELAACTTLLLGIFGLPPAFSFSGLVAGSVIYSLPFQAALRAVPSELLDAGRTLGEFGVVLMIGGSIPGKSRVASIALYDEVQKLKHPHAYAAVRLLVSFTLLLVVNLLQRRAR